MLAWVVHYTPVLSVLFLSGGQHLFQDEFRDWGILGVRFSKITPIRRNLVCSRGDLDSIVFQYNPCSQTILLLWFGSRGQSCHLPVTRVARYRHYSHFVVWINELKLSSAHGLWTGGIFKNSSPKMPRFFKSSWDRIGNRQNWGIM